MHLLRIFLDQRRIFPCVNLLHAPFARYTTNRTSSTSLTSHRKMEVIIILKKRPISELDHISHVKKRTSPQKAFFFNAFFLVQSPNLVQILDKSLASGIKKNFQNQKNQPLRCKFFPNFGLTLLRHLSLASQNLKTVDFFIKFTRE